MAVDERLDLKLSAVVKQLELDAILIAAPERSRP